MSGPITVTKLNWRGEKVYTWQGEVSAREPGHVLLRATWTGPGVVRVADDVTFEMGDVFYEHYYDGKPYGLWQVLGPDERTLKCWYCNISTPAEIGHDGIIFRDLLLDVLLLPDGSTRVLDRDDLARARAEGLDTTLAALAEQALDEVLTMIASDEPPFGDA